jgi:uncharacterized damage-inducible protein DinB
MDIVRLNDVTLGLAGAAVRIIQIEEDDNGELTVIAEEIPEAQYGYRAAPEVRSVSEMLVHIAVAPTMAERIHGEKLTTLEGFDFGGVIGKFMAMEKESRSKAQVIDLLRSEGDRFASWLEGLSDDFLGERIAFPPGITPASKTRFEMILGAKEHEMHHRSQLMLIERMLGIVPHLTREMNARIASMQQQSKAAV